MQLREVSDRLIRHIEDIDAVRERAALAQEELLSLVSEQMNQRMYVLSLVAAVFLPLGFFTGLMGINVGGMPGVEDGNAFWVVVALCVAVMLILAVAFRWKRWL
jgi:zinc transporter